MNIILNDKYEIKNVSEGVSFNEAIDSIAYTATVKLVETDEVKNIGIKKGDKIKIKDISFETKKEITIFNGVIWDVNTSKKNKKIDLNCKERTVYIEESEDEYLFGEGTATTRIKKYCSDWGIPVGNVADTKVKLADAVYRKETILGMMLKDLKETAKKGGDLYKLRMLDKLDLVKVGSNSTVWKLETITEDIKYKSSLDGVVTRVKVLGKNENDNGKSPVIGTYSKNTDKYGTIQKIVQDENVTNSSQASTYANNLFNTGEESVSVSCAVDINTIRSADKVSLNGAIYYVMDITHNKNSISKMTMNLGTLEFIRRKYFNGDI